MNILGIIILVITAACVWRGYAQGLFRTVLIAGATILAMVLSAYSSPHVSKAIQQYTSIDEKIETSITEQLEEYMPQEISTRNEEITVIEALPFPKAIQMAVISNSNSEVYEGLNVRDFKEYLAHYSTCIVMNCLAFIIIQVLITAGLFVLLYVTKALTEIPIIHGIDKTGGVILGLIQALAVIWSLFVVISLIGNTPLGIEAYSQISSNPILNYLFENNWLLNTITNVSNVLFV